MEVDKDATLVNTAINLKRIADLEAQIESLTTELKATRGAVVAFLADTQSARYVTDEYEAILRPGKPTYDFDGLLATLGEHLNAADRNTLCPPTRPCRMCKGSGVEPGVVNGNVAKKIRTYAPKDGVDFARAIDEHTIRGEPSLWVRKRE